MVWLFLLTTTMTLERLRVLDSEEGQVVGLSFVRNRESSPETRA